jgi:magnesium transporter
VIPAGMKEYFRDIYDHVLRLSDQVAAYRDLLTSVLEANLTQVSVRQNEDMRKISAWVAVAVVPTLIAGIFGMNFQRMPGVDAGWGFPTVVGLMALVAGTLYGLFRRSGWL